MIVDTVWLNMAHFYPELWEDIITLGHCRPCFLPLPIIPLTLLVCSHLIALLQNNGLSSKAMGA
jgi:hypothetical protein